MSYISHRNIFTLNHFNGAGHAEQQPPALCRPQAAAPFWVVSEVNLVINNISARHFGRSTC